MLFFAIFTIFFWLLFGGDRACLLGLNFCCLVSDGVVCVFYFPFLVAGNYKACLTSCPVCSRRLPMSDSWSKIKYILNFGLGVCLFSL